MDKIIKLLEGHKIEFRAWNEKQKYMAYQGAPDLEIISSFFHHFGDKKLMLFTGKKDQVNAKIFEADIVKWYGKTSYELDFEHIAVVVWSDEWSGWALYSLSEGCHGTVPIGDHGAQVSEILVLGNIYENKELIVEKKGSSFDIAHEPII